MTTPSERRYRKLPLEITATQWFKNGDHPSDACEWFGTNDDGFEGEGHIVRRFRRPDIGGCFECIRCKREMDDHGWIDTLEGGHTVCPGDWIITGIKGERYPCKPDIFAATYEPAEALSTPQPDGWQDISTAPRDGSMILALNTHMNEMAVVGWGGDEWTDVGGKNAAVTFCVNPGYFDHWRPLPAPPTQEGK